MAINTNDGTGLKDLPATPTIPQNVGKLDVGAIYDATVKALQTGTDLGLNAQQQQASGAILANQTAQNTAQRSLIPSNTAATLAANQGVVTQTPLNSAILATQAQKAQGTVDSTIQATNSTNDLTNLTNQIGKVYGEANLKVAPDIAASTAQLQKGLLDRLKASGNGMVSTPLNGPNGQALGSIIAFVGPDGQPKTQIVPVPYAQLSHINTGTSYIPLGPKMDPATNQPVGQQWQTIYQNAAGGITKGEIFTNGGEQPGPLYQPAGAQGNPPANGAAGAAPAQGATPAAAADGSAGAAPQSVPSAQAQGTVIPGGRVGAEVVAKQAEERMKQRQDFIDGLREERDLLDKSSASIGKLKNDISAEQNSTFGSGPGVGSGIGQFVRSATGDPSAAAVQGDLSNFVSQVMSSAKNIRTQREFNAFTGAIPAPNDPKDVQNDKLAFLTTATNVLKTRTDFVDGLLRTHPNMDPDQADKEAISRFPLPTEPPGGWSVGAKAAPVQATAAKLPTVSSPEDAAKLPSGTHFLDPNGVERVVP